MLNLLETGVEIVIVIRVVIILAANDLIKIWDINGRVILSKSLIENVEVSLDLEGWAEGSYVAVWYQNQRTTNSAKFIIAH